LPAIALGVALVLPSFSAGNENSFIFFPTRHLPDFVVRLLSLFDPGLRSVTPSLGRKHRFTSAKAERILGWTPRPAAETVVDCAESLLAGAKA
jgi:hypothetical protein